LGDNIPLQAEGGYHVTVQNPGVSFQHCMMNGAAKVALAHMEQGIRIAGMAEFAGISTQTNPARSALLIKRLREILPNINTEHYTEWRGNRPSLPDSLPVIGPATQFNNVYYAFGNQHVGLSSGPKTGKLIAQLIAGEPPAIDLQAFRADRF
jgi:D-amino-acid dehydrogenase